MAFFGSSPSGRERGIPSGMRPSRTRNRLALAALLVPLFAACGGPPAATTPAPAPSAAPAPSVAGPTAAELQAREAAASAKARSDEQKLLADVAAEYQALLVAHFPETATALGIHDGDSRLAALDPAGWAAATKALEAFAARIDERRKTPGLSVAATVDLDALRGGVGAAIVRRGLNEHRNQPSVYAAPMNAVFLLGAREFAPAKVRATSALARIDATPAFLTAGKAAIGSGDPPKVWVEIGIDRAKSAKSFYASQRPWLVAALPGEEKRIDASLAKATAAYSDFGTFLKTSILPKAHGSFRAGAEVFSALVKQDYAVSLSPDEIEAIGRKVFARTEAEIAKLALEIDPKLGKDPSKVIAKLKGNHPKENELLDAYRTEVTRARAFLVTKDVVPFPPNDDLQVTETPVFQRATIQAAYDPPPPFDAVSRGFFFVSPVEKEWGAKQKEEWLRESDHGDIVDTAVHEAYPGHHLQLSFSRLHPSPVRKALDTAIFSEGWALYSEELMNELGYYTKEERMLQLEWALVRAARVILDVGLHTKGMSVEEAETFLMEKVHLERGLAHNEARRYSESPTQPLSYMLGRERIFALREQYLKQPGATLRGFHDALLRGGSIPPDLIARELFGNRP